MVVSICSAARCSTCILLFFANCSASQYLRKDQIYFVDKCNEDGVSELYGISDFSTRTTENIRKGYLVGKYGAIPNIDIEGVE